VSHKDFIGCMRDLHIDGRRMDMAAFVANNGTMAGRPSKFLLFSIRVPVSVIRKRWRVAWDASTSDPNPVLDGKIHTVVQPVGPYSPSDYFLKP
jgi:hypothetical protein